MNFEADKEINLYKNIIISLLNNQRNNINNIILDKLEEYINKNKLIDDIIYYKLLYKYNIENNIILDSNIIRLQNTLSRYEILLQENNIIKNNNGV